MPKKKTVDLNIPVVLALIKKEFRSNVVFCEKMGRTSGKWVSDWCRKGQDENPKPKNLPSPEEAAKMCLLLDTTPDDILLAEGDTAAETAKRQADIELVRGLLEELKADQGMKKDTAGIGGVELTDMQKEAWDLLQKMDDDTLRRFIAAAKAMLGE